MTVHLYLSLIPEALIASMLTPEEFGVYYSVGTSKKRRGQAMFVELDPDFRHDVFRIDEGIGADLIAIGQIVVDGHTCGKIGVHAIGGILPAHPARKRRRSGEVDQIVTSAQTDFEEIGDGMIDMDAIMTAAVDVGVAHAHVEQDQSPDALASIRQSIKAVNAM